MAVGANDLLQDVASGSCPDKLFEVGAVVSDVFIDSSHQFRYAGEHAAAQAFGCNVAEEALDHVQPRR